MAANAKKEMDYFDSEELLTEQRNEEERKSTKESVTAKQRSILKLFNLLFPKRKMEN